MCVYGLNSDKCKAKNAVWPLVKRLAMVSCKKEKQTHLQPDMC